MHVLFGIAGLFYLLNLAFAVYNASKYMFPINRGNRLVKMFYVLVITVCLTHLYYCFFFAINPDYESIIFGDDKGHMRLEILVETIGTCSMSAVNWLVCAIMYKLTLSI